jgi:hypothetical protein
VPPSHPNSEHSIGYSIIIIVDENDYDVIPLWNSGECEIGLSRLIRFGDNCVREINALKAIFRATKADPHGMGVNGRGHGEHPAGVKTAVGDQHMQTLGIWLL